jgi:hypothetical protein
MKPKQRTKNIPSSYSISTMVQQYSMTAAASSSKSTTTRRRVVSSTIKSKWVHTHNDNTNEFILFQLERVAHAFFQNRLVRILCPEVGLFQVLCISAVLSHTTLFLHQQHLPRRIWKSSNLHILWLQSQVWPPCTYSRSTTGTL